MKSFNKFIFLSTFLLISYGLSAQENVTLSGYVKDVETGEELIGANVYVKELNSGTATNAYGFYSLSLPPGTYTVSYLFIGYKTISKEVEIKSSQTVNVELGTEDYVIDEAVVTGERKEQNITDVEMSVAKVSISTIKQIPQLLGEVDVIRSILLLPGVTTVGEGASGFNVRGGNVDQNLILLDEAPVYSSSHLFGFFSVFNADALKDLKLYKGGIPANFGGRLSSVLDVRQKEGNMKTFSGNGGIGILSSRLTLEGPIQKEKSSFMVAGRRSYADVFTRLSSNKAIKDNILYFYDLNAKVNYKFNDKDRIFLSAYLGNDVFKFGDDFEFKWGNATTTLRWNHLFNDRLFSNFTAIYSDYTYSLGIPEGAFAFEWTSNIFNYNLKTDFTYYINPKNTIDFGASALFYKINPGHAKGVGSESNFGEIKLEKQRAAEPALYISHEHHFSEQLKIQYGLRYSLFYRTGAGTVYSYDPNQAKDPSTIIDTTTYKSGEVIKSYGGPEPRLSMNYIIDEESSVKMSYNRTRQYIHLISNTTAVTPVDVWRPSGEHIEPAIADQVALGYFRNFENNKYESSIEVYYKKFDNLIDYKDGAELLFNETLEADLLSGEGRAYGLEFMFKKQEGRLTGWISYTLARTERKIDGKFGESINGGDYYPSNYDKLHDISIVATYKLNEKWDLGANFAFMSGRPITYPDAKWQFEGTTLPNYGNRNGERTPSYHRLDFSATYKKPVKKDRNWESSWSFGVYNLYARRNPYSIFFRQQENNPLVTEAVRLSIFGSLIPFVTYNFKF